MKVKIMRSLTISALCGVFLLLSVNGFAASQGPKLDGARAFVEKVADRALSDVAGKTTVAGIDAEKSFRKLLKDAFDLDVIAKFTLGRNWRTATPGEQKEFKSSLEDLIVRSYTKRLKDYNGKGYEIIGTQAVSEKDTGVNMVIYPTETKENPIALTWRVRNNGGKYKIIDLSVEGVSMSVTQRTEFASVIQRNGGSLQALIDSLNQKENLE